jgi:hypothetical protein
MNPQFNGFQKFEIVIVLWLASAIVTDVTITSSLVWHLVRPHAGMAYQS